MPEIVFPSLFVNRCRAVWWQRAVAMNGGDRSVITTAIRAAVKGRESDVLDGHCVTDVGGRPMRGGDARTEALFSYVSCEARVPKDHPLRAIRAIVYEALPALSPRFEDLYAKSGRTSIPPEKLLRALLLQALYSVRSEHQLMEQLDYNLLFRWLSGCRWIPLCGT